VFETHAVTEAAPGRPNEDFYLMAADWLIVLDGVAATPGQANGCIHGVRWFVGRLGARLATTLATGTDESLKDVLANAITETMSDHGPQCDLSKPLTPAATVAIVRQAAEQIDWLALGDVTVAWQLSDGTTDSFTDNRLDLLPNAPIIVADVRRYDPEYVITVRNTPGGFWVAAADPAAAYEAITGSVALDQAQTLAVFTDGLARLAERYGHQWRDVFELAHVKGMRALVDQLRQDEIADPDPTRWRGKLHDDATGILWRRVGKPSKPPS